MHETQKVPAYIFKAHHSILIGISWDSFVPQLSAFDQMIQVRLVCSYIIGTTDARVACSSVFTRPFSN